MSAGNLECGCYRTCTCPTPSEVEEIRQEELARERELKSLADSPEGMDYEAQREANLQRWGLRPKGKRVEAKRWRGMGLSTIPLRRED